MIKDWTPYIDFNPNILYRAATQKGLVSTVWPCKSLLEGAEEGLSFAIQSIALGAAAKASREQPKGRAQQTLQDSGANDLHDPGPATVAALPSPTRLRAEP